MSSVIRYANESMIFVSPTQGIATSDDDLLRTTRPGHAEAFDYDCASVAVNTKRAYQSGWRMYTQWCDLHNCDPLGAKLSMDNFADQTRRYLAMRKRSGRKLSTINMDLVIINQARIEHHLEGIRRHPTVMKLLVGMHRSVKSSGEKVRKVSAITPQMLRAMLGSLSSDMWGIRNKALLLIAFSGGMRRTEPCMLKRGDAVLLR